MTDTNFLRVHLDRLERELSLIPIASGDEGFATARTLEAYRRFVDEIRAAVGKVGG